MKLENTLGVGRWFKVGKSKSFTKKGPGRRHNYMGLTPKFHAVDVHREFDLRLLHGRLTDAFIRRYRKDMAKN